MPDRENKPLMRSLGEFVGYIYKAVLSDPGRERTILNKTTEQQRRGAITLRRTTVEEIELDETKQP